MHPKLQTLLSRLRHRVRRYIVWDSLLIVAAAILAAFWIAFLIDYLPVRIGGSEMPRSARSVVLAATLGLTAALVWRFLISPLRRELPNDSLALLIERQHPELRGSLVTAVQLGESPRKGDAHSATFMKGVFEEAERQVPHVDLDRVFRTAPIRQKLMLVVPLLLAVVIMAVASPSTFARAISRLTLWSDSPWPRRAHLEMVGVEVPVIAAAEDDEGATRLVNFDQGVVRLARGSNATLRIRAAGDEHGHQIPALCTVSYVDEDGKRGQSNLRRVGRVVDGYQSFVLDGPPLSSLASSVSLTIRGLDDRLTDYRIEAVDPPAIAEMRMHVRYPDYLRVFSVDEQYDQQLDYQAGVRIREGSSLTLMGRTSSPIGEVDVVVTGPDFDAPPQTRGRPSSTAAATTLGVTAPPEKRAANVLSAKIADDAMSFTLQLDDVRSATSVRIVPRDAEGISAQAAYRYFIGVVRDEPPVTTMKLSGIGSAITPIAILPITATATDDYGVDEMKITMTVRNEPEQRPQQPTDPAPASVDAVPADEQVHALTPELDREGRAELAIDLRELVDQAVLQEIIPGATVILGTSAQDRFNLNTEHVTQGELVRLQVVTPETLLATLERRELEFRARLEQAIDETRRLRQSLTAIEGEATDVIEKLNADVSLAASAAGDADARDEVVESNEVDAAESIDTADQQGDVERADVRARQRVQLRIRQAGLQAAKSTDELAGIVAGLDDLVLEMVNNRIDSVDRRERLEQGVREPLQAVVEEPFPQLGRQIVELERILMSTVDPASPDNTDVATVSEMEQGVQQAIATNDEILLQLSAVLEKMLDLESFNEILDLMRGLIEDQDRLLDETEDEQKNRVLDLFK